jgi:hypothetical protein
MEAKVRSIGSCKPNELEILCSAQMIQLAHHGNHHLVSGFFGTTRLGRASS